MQLYVADCVVTLNITCGCSVGAAGVWKWVGGLYGSILTGSGTSPQIPATPGADGLASLPIYYVQFWWLQLLRHLVKSSG